jgi:ribosomal-protein-alanine N-acetyltransferase
VATDARRKEIYWARYLDGVRIEGPDVSRPADVAAGSGAMAGAGARLYADVLGPSLIDRDFPCATALVQRAADRIRTGAPTELLTPLYLRRPDAVEPGRPKVVTLPRRPLPRRLRPSRRGDPQLHWRGDPHSAPAVAVVAMSAEHIDALMPYERSMFGTEAWTASGYRTELADTERRHYLVAQGDKGDLLGWAGVMVIADSAEILTVGVIPTARRLGIARLLLDGLLAEARQRGAVEAFLEVRVDNEAAQSLYKHEGFVQVGLRPGYYDGGRVDAAVMRREL